MKNKSFVTALGLLLLTGISAVLVVVFNLSGLSQPAKEVMGQTETIQAAPAQSSAAQVAGDYSGVVKLQVTVAGLYSDTLPSQPITGTPDLGSIDLSLSINQSGSTLSGYVSLDKTLVFSVEHTIQSGGAALKIGPTINGSFDGTNLTLLSERVATNLNGQSIQRQFRLTGVISQSDGSQISGEYRETLWGAARLPVTVIGSFTLQRPVFGKSAPDTSNKTPETVADTATTTQGVAVTVNVLTNDTDANGDALTITSLSKPQFGAAAINGQSVIYTPNANFVGTDTVTYFVSDGKGGTAAGSLTVTVNGPGGINQLPTAANDSATTPQGVAVLVNVLSNDADPDSDPLTITIDSQPGHGTAVVENGQIRYTPTANFAGTDALTYVISDGKGGTATATITVTVTATSGGNQPPVAGNDAASTASGTAITIDVLINDSDPDGDALTLTIATPPAHGTAAVENGKIVYTPNAGFVGTDSLTYEIADGKGDATIATLTITVGEAAQPGHPLYLPLISRS